MPLKKLEQFSVSHLQILDEEGNVDRDLEPDLTEEQLIQLYRTMNLAREHDQRMLKLQRQGRIGTFGPCTGQEACSLGPAFAMSQSDWFVGAFRELAGRLAMGEPLENSLVFHNGFEEGNANPDSKRNLLPISIIVASQCLHAAGIGYALKYQGKKNAAAVTFLGDGGSSQGDFYEAMNFAGVWQAPVVFIVQNNQWAISVPRSKQTHAATIAQKAIAAGIHGIQVDGNDILAMVVATRDALDRAYAGEGPTLIEAMTYRLMMHTTADDPRKYRSEEEEQEAWKREPIARFRTYLEKKGMWDASRQEAMEKEIKETIDTAVRSFEERTDFKPDLCFDHVFGTRHEEIEEQRAQFLADRRLDAAKEASDA